MKTRVQQDILQLLAELGEVLSRGAFRAINRQSVLLAKGPSNEAIWDVEDEELLAAARKHAEDRRKSTADAQSS